MLIRFEPLDVWPEPPTKPRRNGTFRVGYADLLDHLEKEIGYLGGKSATIAACVTRAEIRNNGHLRASARPSMPGIIVFFTSRHGDVSFPCDTYTNWRDNLRAIGLTMELLRGVERYGATKGSAQYKGYLALPAPESPAEILLRLAGRENTPEARQQVESDAAFRKEVYHAAAKQMHPDSGGYTASMQAVNNAYESLNK